MEKKELKMAAKEYGKVIELDTPLNLKSETLEKDLYDVLTLIEKGDEFTAETEAVFAELRAKYDKPKGKSKSDKKADKKEKHKKEIKVQAGDTVDIEVETDKIKKVEKMKKDKKGSEKEPAVGNVGIIKTILDREVKKDELLNLINTEEVFAKSKKALKKVTNFMSLKKQMLEVFPEEQVKALREEMPPIPHGKKKEGVISKVKDILAEAIENATKVKELKKIAKGSPDKYNWKKLKKMDFDEMQKAMLDGGKKSKAEKKEPAKPKMIPNPLIAEMEAFENKKLKKLVKWAKERPEFAEVKKLKKYQEFAEMRDALVAAIPAEIEVKSKSKSKSSGPSAARKESNVAERKEMATKMIKEGTYTRTEILTEMDAKFPGYEKANANLLSECKSVRPISGTDQLRWEKFGLNKLVEESKKGFYRFVK